MAPMAYASVRSFLRALGFCIASVTGRYPVHGSSSFVAQDSSPRVLAALRLRIDAQWNSSPTPGSARGARRESTSSSLPSRSSLPPTPCAQIGASSALGDGAGLSVLTVAQRRAYRPQESSLSHSFPTRISSTRELAVLGSISVVGHGSPTALRGVSNLQPWDLGLVGSACIACILSGQALPSFLTLRRGGVLEICVGRSPFYEYSRTLHLCCYILVREQDFGLGGMNPRELYEFAANASLESPLACAHPLGSLPWASSFALGIGEQCEQCAHITSPCNLARENTIQGQNVSTMDLVRDRERRLRAHYISASPAHHRKIDKWRSRVRPQLARLQAPAHHLNSSSSRHSSFVPGISAPPFFGLQAQAWISRAPQRARRQPAPGLVGSISVVRALSSVFILVARSVVVNKPEQDV
ncbi:hypothetical protein C8F04DRAFT_1325268 [Mycena alexandri]|uniref:Uncharacterized protein n=1 Tax=Mycena alexandri TaxID=1745969 RepID=A0AAD6T4T9_9AGAR|nr:hypothetical protein C8F04DRAFT_1325268 [Mycena alexandri]